MSTEILGAEYFSEVIGRLMLVLDIQKEYEIAALMGFKKDTFSARKKRGALPEDRIKLLCADKMINFDWVMTGKGRQFSQEVSAHPAHTGVFPKEFDPDLLLQVTEGINDVIEKAKATISKDRLTKITMLAYADAFWRGKYVNQEYLEYLVDVSCFKEGALSRERIFIEAASGGLSGGFVVCEQLPEIQGWLGGIKVIEIIGESKDDGHKIAAKLLKKLKVEPSKATEVLARQLKGSLEDIYRDREYRHLTILINDAHVLSKNALGALKVIHEMTSDAGRLPGFVLIGPVKKIIATIDSVKDIRERSILIDENQQIVGWPT